MTNNDKSTAAAGSGTRHTAGAFDVRNIIAALMVTYGVILVLMGLFGTQDTSQDARATEVNVNLWVGVGLLVFGIAMGAWARLRPTIVDDREVEADRQADGGGKHL